jgi:2-polyprenyl-3-methyl-5-hydroxy-6-metoxy-1,4-benzoquinol methylase
LRPAHAGAGAGGFGTLSVVECESCGHLYNAAFDSRRVDDLYAALVLTNEPVSPGMLEAVAGIADLILRHAKPRPTVLEVGGGGGGLSLLLARHARHVDLVEPSRAVSADRFAGTAVTLHNVMFPTPALAGRTFDVVACRQVIEHVPDPAPFLAALRVHLAEGGLAYLELPSAEYIRGHRSVVDFHYPHVHYYRRGEIEVLLARAGFAIIDAAALKNGHDVAFLLRAAAPSDAPAPARALDDDLASALAARRARGRDRLAAMSGPIALYGANAYSQALLGLYPDVGKFAAMLDDTPSYAGQRAYGPAIDLEIEPPRAARLARLGAVVITAYLHDRPIATKLRVLGFSGPLFTVRSDADAGAGDVPESLFSTSSGSPSALPSRNCGCMPKLSIQVQPSSSMGSRSGP